MEKCKVRVCLVRRDHMKDMRKTARCARMKIYMCSDRWKLSEHMLGRDVFGYQRKDSVQSISGNGMKGSGWSENLCSRFSIHIISYQVPAL